jgi:hypothetical protein
MPVSVRYFVFGIFSYLQFLCAWIIFFCDLVCLRLPLPSRFAHTFPLMTLLLFPRKTKPDHDQSRNSRNSEQEALWVGHLGEQGGVTKADGEAKGLLSRLDARRECRRSGNSNESESKSTMESREASIPLSSEGQTQNSTTYSPSNANGLRAIFRIRVLRSSR